MRWAKGRQGKGGSRDVIGAATEEAQQAVWLAVREPCVPILGEGELNRTAKGTFKRFGRTRVLQPTGHAMEPWELSRRVRVSRPLSCGVRRQKAEVAMDIVSILSTIVTVLVLLVLLAAWCVGFSYYYW